MSPFKHNIRNLGKAFYRAATPEHQRTILFAALANVTCHMNRNDADALEKIVPMMERDMKAAGVQPVST